MKKNPLKIETEAAWQQEDRRSERKQERGGKKKSNPLRVKGKSINSTCAGRLATLARKLHVNKYSKHLPPTIFLPPDSATAISKRQTKRTISASTWPPSSSSV